MTAIPPTDAKTSASVSLSGDAEIAGAIHEWLLGFELDRFVHGHVHAVMAALPEAVRADLISDPRFTICDYEPGPGAVMRVRVGIPGAAGADGQAMSSRSVVFKRTLRRRPVAFVRWLIAHELAHAHLRNEGRWEGDDPEYAADALAAEWGFPRPERDKSHR